jgi:hypothetical protein
MLRLEAPSQFHAVLFGSKSRFLVPAFGGADLG